MAVVDLGVTEPWHCLEHSTVLNLWDWVSGLLSPCARMHPPCPCPNPLGLGLQLWQTPQRLLPA